MGASEADVDTKPTKGRKNRAQSTPHQRCLFPRLFFKSAPPRRYVQPNGAHEGVETEWATAQVVSAYNAIVDADACCTGNMANAALYMHAPLLDRWARVHDSTPPFFSH